MENELIVSEQTREFEDDFVYQTMLTCIGNKRKLVKNIIEIVTEISIGLGKDKLNIVDGFAGSSVVSRGLSHLADHIYTNDMELYSYLMAQCYLITPTEQQRIRIQYHIDTMNQLTETGPYIEGIICKLYAPKDSSDIKEGERCFYTHENALIIDTLRKYISDRVEPELTNYCLVPLLNKASIHTNTAGVFKGFYKKDKIGHFGGTGENALSRIIKPIRLDMPIWSSHPFHSVCSNENINILVKNLPDNIDIMYLDPPYNQHPYGSNYFMLNVIAKNEEPMAISKVSGIPVDWQRSDYNNGNTALDAMKELIKVGLTKSKYILISYNNEGIIPQTEWQKLIEQYNMKKYEILYDAFKGSRNLKERSDKVVEIMYLIKGTNV